ncbi:protein kinase [Rhodococcus koreensis]|uniref:protein kinase domain-containing protein n=1 Tax=Rhodococcus koreensis TaxID=99653 RepID=UPI00366D656C
MAEPNETQRDVSPAVTAELGAIGFENASEIGRGGFGAVYRCLQPALDRTVAVKILTSDLDAENLDRFLREQRAMGRLTGHPHIVHVLQVGATDSGRPYIVMPYCPQDSLEALIRRSGPIRWNEALRLGVKMAGALETAHRLGILHRDVKPANILLTDYGEPQLTDFGIAHIAGGFETATGTVTGSPAYTAPEVLKGDPSTPTSDVYGLGATLFCAITGHAAFERRSGEQVVAQFLRITTGPIPDLREQGIPDDVSAAIERSMSGAPGDRPSTAAEFGDQLRQAQLRNDCPVDEMAFQSTTDPQQHVGDDPHGGFRFAGPEGGKSRASSADSGEHLRQTLTPARDSLPQRTVRGIVGNLPLELTSFIGRRRELNEAKRLLSVSRLVTLTGIGGVGKTRLALQVATGAGPTFDDGAWLVELGELRDASLLAEVVAGSLGVRDQSAQPGQEALVEYLASRRLLLVLDNCEQLVDAVAQFAQTVLRTCPELRILATSREPLRIGGEAAMRLSPLLVPDPIRPPPIRGLPGYDAVTLFSERAAAAVPEFRITEENRVTVVQICHRLDGLPLPIELAAAQLRALSAAQVLERLTDRFQLLTRGSRGAPTRQQTLRLCIDWSHELCTPREQQLWAQLAVFAGGFELDAAEGICPGTVDPSDVLDVVGSLVDKSILIREEPGAAVRYRLLDTLCAYGREKIQETGEYTMLRRRHRDWYLQLVSRAETEWISSRQLEWISRLEREQPNLRKAMEFCTTGSAEAEIGLQIAAALYPFWLCRGLLSEGRYWLDRMMALQGGKPTAQRLTALCVDGVLAGRQGDLATGTALVDEGREIAENVGDAAAHALVTHASGRLALYGGQLPRAVALLSEALQEFRDNGNHLLRIATLQGLGLAHGMLGHTVREIACHEEVLATTEALGESEYRAYSLWGLWLARWQQDDNELGPGLLENSLRLTRLVDDPLCSALCLEALAWLAADEHRSRRAAVLMGTAEGLGQAVGSPKVHIPALRTYHEKHELQIRRALGERAFESAYRRGMSLSLHEAVAYALDEPSPEASKRDDSAAATLTRREREVADLVAQGLTNKAIAAQLVISPRTAQGHVEHILAKLGFTSRTQIASWIVEQAQWP